MTLDIWVLISDLNVVMLLALGTGTGFAFGRGSAPPVYVYIEDDGKGGIQPATDFDPDVPKPGDPLYVPENWTVNA